MEKRKKILIFIVIGAVAVAAAVLITQQRSGSGYRRQSAAALNKYLHIENYIFTKVSPNRALLRIYGTNTADEPVSYFPVTINYISEAGAVLGQDTCDLLADRGQLDARGEFSAEVTVSYPPGTQTAAVDIAAK